jgi:uncharacterized protein involved in cysteine biosynthesis
LFLFVISLLVLPLFLYLYKKPRKFPASIPHLGWVLIPALLIFLGHLSPGIGGKNFIYYCLFFVFGYWMMAENRFSEAADKYKTWAFALGPGSMVLFPNG